MNVLNMLNTRYIIIPNKETGGTIVQKNPDALGNAWFVDSIKWVSGPDEEIVAITDFNPRKTAVIDQIWKDKLNNPESLQTVADSSAEIVLMEHYPGAISYKTTNHKNQLAVFSEVYYKTWKATIDGNEAPIIRVNYILRVCKYPKAIMLFNLPAKTIYLLKDKSFFVGLCYSRVAMLSLIALIIINLIRNKNNNTNASTE